MQPFVKLKTVHHLYDHGVMQSGENVTLDYFYEFTDRFHIRFKVQRLHAIIHRTRIIAKIVIDKRPAVIRFRLIRVYSKALKSLSADA